jgi:hypothetical protein
MKTWNKQKEWKNKIETNKQKEYNREIWAKRYLQT